ncbi:MAG: SGNH/GDSL hydrolase family protein [Chloroflexi bacterium]|nr:SGNH/GDSL hydrolase family protein [Chloroflexota bacterium]
MKRVVLIGDSIRIGYQGVVRRELEGLAEVGSPDQNGGTSQNVLDHLDEWALAPQPDVVHLNCGLHDLRKEFGSDQSAVPLDRYQANLEVILRRLRKETHAKVIWALTTPVNEAWHHARKPFDRFEADVIAYNRVAAEICQRMAVPMNDLYQVAMRAGRDQILLPDGVHFTPEGYTILGEAVAGAIRGYL